MMREVMAIDIMPTPVMVNEVGGQVVSVELSYAELVELFTGRLVGRHQETMDAIGDDVDAYLDSHPAFKHIPNDPYRIYIRLALACPDALEALERVRFYLKWSGVDAEAKAQSAIPADYWYDKKEKVS